MTAILLDNGDMYLIDSGSGMKEPDTPGHRKRILTPHYLSKVTRVNPNFSIITPYLNQGYVVRGVIITHIHNDHTGSIPMMVSYLKSKNQDPIYYGSKTTMTLLKSLDIHLNRDKIVFLEEDVPLIRDGLTIQSIPVNHSTIGTVSLYLTYKGVKAYYLPDFCRDYLPVIGPNQVELDKKWTEIGKKGLDLLICESTVLSDASGDELECPPTEAQVCARLESIIRNLHLKMKGIVVAGFATNPVRTIATIRAALGVGREVITIGLNLSRLLLGYRKLGLLTTQEFKKIHSHKEFPSLTRNKSEYLILTTGHQGEYLAGVPRMLRDEIRYNFDMNDTLILTSRTIPKTAPIINKGDMFNQLRMRRVHVVDEVHKSGHISGTELISVLRSLEPKHVFANHGDYFQQAGWYVIMSRLDRDVGCLVMGKNGQAVSYGE